MSWKIWALFFHLAFTFYADFPSDNVPVTLASSFTVWTSPAFSLKDLVPGIPLDSLLVALSIFQVAAKCCLFKDVTHELLSEPYSFCYALFFVSLVIVIKFVAYIVLTTIYNYLYIYLFICFLHCFLHLSQFIITYTYKCIYTHIYIYLFIWFVQFVQYKQTIKTKQAGSTRGKSWFGKYRYLCIIFSL